MSEARSMHLCMPYQCVQSKKLRQHCIGQIWDKPEISCFFAADQTKLTQLVAIHASQLLPSSFTTISCAFTRASTLAAAHLLAAYMPFYFWLYCTQDASTTGVHTPPTRSSNNTAVHDHHIPPPTLWDPCLAACITVPLLAVHLPVYLPCHASRVLQVTLHRGQHSSWHLL
jgi:hypothetical protein